MSEAYEYGEDDFEEEDYDEEYCCTYSILENYSLTEEQAQKVLAHFK